MRKFQIIKIQYLAICQSRALLIYNVLRTFPAASTYAMKNQGIEEVLSHTFSKWTFSVTLLDSDVFLQPELEIGQAK